MYEYLSDRLRVERSLEGRKYYGDRLTEIMKDLGKDYDLKKGFTTAIKQYIQGRCVEKEKEYEEAKHVYNVEMLRRYKEEEKQRKIAERKAEIEDFSKRMVNTVEVAKNIPENVRREYENLQRVQARYKWYADRIGIPFTMEVDENSITQSISEIKENIAKIQEHLEELGIDEKSSRDEVQDNTDSLADVEQIVANAVQRTSGDMHRAVLDYDTGAMFQTKKNIDEQVFHIINSSRIQKLQQKRQEIADKKISFFGKIRGADKLQEIELQNMDIEIEMARTALPPRREKYSTRDSLADMFAYSMSEMGSQLTPEMQALYDGVTGVFKISYDDIVRRANEKLASYPIEQPENSTGSISRRIEDAQARNQELSSLRARMAADNYGRSQVGNIGAVSDFSRAVYQVATITRANTKDDRNIDLNKNSQSYDYHE